MGIVNGWKRIIDEEKEKDYFKNLKSFLLEEYSKNNVYPRKGEIFKCFELTDFKDVKVVILGQDPYHQPFQAHGLCFSVNDGIQFPPSLQNIFKEINSDLGIPMPKSGNLTRWAEQGVLLLNTVLTVRAHQANSHAKLGWEEFTDEVIKAVNAHSPTGVVFILWGNPAQKKARLVDGKRHHILACAHPSPLSAYRGFFGSNIFRKANELLEKSGKTPIKWVQ